MGEGIRETISVTHGRKVTKGLMHLALPDTTTLT